jgi:hypothetical protein
MTQKTYQSQNTSIFNTSPHIVIAGEINCAIRATGDVLNSGIEPTGAGNAIRDGRYKEIDQVTVGVMSYADFQNSIGWFAEPCSSGYVPQSGKHPWNSVGAAGLDVLFSPYTTALETGKYLPHFETPTSTDVGTSLTLNPYNPFNSLDAGTGYIPTEEWYASGHNLTMALSFNPYDSGVPILSSGASGEVIGSSGGLVGSGGLYPNYSGAPIDFYFEKDHFVRHKTEFSGIKSVGFKAPMVLTGWGYDTDGNPVPSSGGQLHPQAAYKPSLWKTGPVDLRWDDARKVWTGGGGGTSAFYLCKVTNTYNPTSFSFEVDRSKVRDQYARNAPINQRAFSATEAIYDPEYVAYVNNPDNKGQYESLDFGGIDFPHYEAFIIRSTADNVNSASYYNIWTEDCDDCGVVQNSCAESGDNSYGVHSGVSTDRKILIENPLRQALDVGDLCFTVSTGRSKSVNTGSFSGGSVSGVASGELIIDQNGSGYINVSHSGSGYTAGGFALLTSCDLCVDITLYFESAAPYGLSSGTVVPDTNLGVTGTCPLEIYPADATGDTEMLPVHWIMQSEFKSQQVVTHAECSAGVLQTCTMKIQTQGFKTCEHCGEDTAFINAYS